MPSLADYDVDTLSADLTAAGLNPVHAARLLRSFHAHGGRVAWGDVPQVGPRVRRWVEGWAVDSTAVLSDHTAADGTAKLLVGLADGRAVESVLMPSHAAGVAAGCVSSQVGCAMGCDFCASTRGGFDRHLTAGEIVAQFLHLKAHAASAGRRLKTLVFMGMGEPLLNLDNVLPAIRRIAHADMGGLGWRQITVSTVGIVPGIDSLLAADLNVHLALSLHAPDDATRTRLVPSNRRWPVADVMAAARRFLAATGRIPTIEYTLLAGVNDHDEQASLLAGLMVGFRGHVNLIPYNPTGPGVSGVTYARPSPARVATFLSILRSAGVVAHVRQTRGDDVNAACGQLRERARRTPLAVV